MRLFAILYFLVLGYCVRAFGWDKAMVKAAGNILDAVAERWTLAADETRRELEAGRGT